MLAVLAWIGIGLIFLIFGDLIGSKILTGAGAVMILLLAAVDGF